MKKTNRIIGMLLAISLVCTAIMYSMRLSVDAAFENNYTNTGNHRADIIGVAQTQLGYTEGYNNDTKYGTWYGLPNQPWCAMFVSWCARQADIPTSILKNSSCAGVGSSNFNLSYENGAYYVPKQGDLFFTKSWSHVGLVWYTEGNYFYTIEGNSNNTGSSEGYAVCSNKRLISSYYFGTPNYNDVVVTHSRDNSYSTEFTAYLKNPGSNHYVFNASHNNTGGYVNDTDPCTIHEVYTDGCCKFSYLTSSGSTKTAYGKIDWFICDGNTHVVTWLGDSQGNEKSDWVMGETVYLWYKIFDPDTGKMFNTYRNCDYTVTETLYKPNGEVSNSHTYDNDDNAWIGHSLVSYDYGQCSYRVVVKWGDGSSDSVCYDSFFVDCNATLSVDKTSINLNTTNNKTATVTYSINGTWPENNSIEWVYDKSIISLSGASGQPTRTITALSAGETDLELVVYVNSKTKIIRNVSTHIIVSQGSYTLSYSANGGSGAPSSQTGATKYTISSTRPTRVGYNFLGWSKNNSATSAAYYPSDDISLTSNTTLYAVWGQKSLSSSSSNNAPIAYSNQIYYYKFTPSTSGTYVIYSTQDQEVANTTIDTNVVLYNSSGTKLSENDDANNRDFNFRLAYSLTAGTTYYYGVSYSWDDTGNISFKFGSTYTITYNANGGSGAPSSQTKDYGTSLTLSSTIPTRSGYSFLGWSTNNSATSASYSAGGSYTSNSNATLYAVWSQSTYTLSYSANGGSGAPSSQTGATSYTISSTIPTRIGYNFLGWSKNNTATSATYTAGNSITISSDTTLYAIWKQVSLASQSNGTAQISNAGQMYYFKVTPSSTGKYVLYSTGSDDTKGSLYNTSGTELASNDDYNGNRNFRVEYNLTSGTTYYYGVKYYSSSTTGSISVTFGPVYTITYNANGGSGAPSSQSKDYGVALTLSSTTPTRSGYSFLGWSTNNSATSASYSAGGSYTSNSNATLYAVWNQNHTHSYSSFVTKPATCISTGIKTYTCSCGESYTETISVDSNNHVNTKSVDATASTCIKKGYTAGVYCNDCQKYISGHIEQPLAAHQTTLQYQRSATCTNTGYTGDEVCTVCTQTIKTGRVVDALGHTAPDANGNCMRCNAHIKDVTPTTQPNNQNQPQQQNSGCKWCGGNHDGVFGWLIAIFHNLFASIFGAKY